MLTSQARPLGLRCAPVLIGLLLLPSACQQPVVSDASAPAKIGGVELALGKAEVRYIELTAGAEVIQYPDPVLVVPLTVTNSGPDAFTYTPTHGLPQMSEATTPLLYADPGPEASLPPENKAPIPSVVLKKGQMPGQMTQAKLLQAGEKVQDFLLFQLPPKNVTKLILSLPPTMHREKVPVLFRMGYTPQTPTGRKIHQVGEDIAVGDMSLKVSAHNTEYVKIKSGDKEGFSNKPLFKISYTITNNSQAAASYDPPHKVQGDIATPRLSNASETFKRMKFDGSVRPEGQLDGKQVIEPGKSVTDYALFEPPGPDAQEIVFEFPAVLFKGEGVARVAIPYAYKKPEKPKALQDK